MPGLEAGEIAAIGTGAVGLIQTGISLFEKGAARRRQNKLFKQRQTYQTPQEAFDILHARQQAAQQGYDPATLAYLTGESDKAFGATLGAAQRLGADANTLSAIFDQKVNSIMKVGAENHALNMVNFDKALGAVEMIQQNKVAEYVSRDNKLRDQLAAAGVDFQNANTGLNSGLNAILASGAAYAQMQLYKDPKKPNPKDVTPTSTGGGSSELT